jgi:hypothetical protein
MMMRGEARLSSVRHDSGADLATWSERALRPTPCIHEVNRMVVIDLVRYQDIESSLPETLESCPQRERTVIPRRDLKTRQ